MAWNTGGYIFESQVIGIYDLGKLDKDLLKILAEPFANTDIDYGDIEGKSQDGKCLYEIVVEIMDKLPIAPKGKRKNNEAWDNYQYEIYEKFCEIVEQFGW